MKKNKKIGVITSFLGPDANVEGTIEFQGTIRVDGKMKGKINGTGGTVIVGEKAIVNADMIVDGAIIMGEFNGTIDAKERIEVYPPARVMGDIQSPIISIDTGAIFNGNCGMKSRLAQIKKIQDSQSKDKKNQDSQSTKDISKKESKNK